MFWSSKKKSDDTKEKQIKELKQVFPSVRRPNNDDNLFEIKFVVNNQYSSLRVFIPADFPSTRPVLQAAGPITHPWLDQFKQVNGSDKLMMWTRNSSLVEVVEESLSALLTGTNSVEGVDVSANAYPAIPIPTATAASTVGIRGSSPDLSSYPAAGAAQLHYSQPGQAAPPIAAATYHYQPAQPVPIAATVVPLQSQSFGGYPTPQPPAPNPSSSANNNTNSNRQTPVSGPDLAMAGNVTRGTSGAIPALPSSFPELENMSIIQLQRLLNDNVTLEAQVDSGETAKQMLTVLEQVRQSNEELARKNVLLEAELKAASEEAEAQQSALKVAVHVYQEKLAAAKASCVVPMDAVVKELKANKNALDSSSEDIGVRFVDGKINLPEFISGFVEQRSQYHELTAKLKILAK